MNCPDCEEGRTMACIDDMCRSVGECMYERGDQASLKTCFQTCPTCKGAGWLDPDDDEVVEFD